MLDTDTSAHQRLTTASDSSEAARIVVAISTVGRPAILLDTLQRIAAQTRQPDEIVICAPAVDDVEGTKSAYPHVRIIIGPRGLPHQRNAIIRELGDQDNVVFFDDDFVPAARYLEAFEKLLQRNPNVVMATGKVLADGIGGKGLDFVEADRIVAQANQPDDDCPALEDVPNGYGCNMGFRVGVAKRNGLAFDENLPLYAWLEDVDFGQQLARHGRVVRCDGLQGVHLGIKSGRQSGVRLGYSQIANPIYLIGKGTCGWKRGVYMMSRNFAANVLRSFSPEPWIDRRGRLSGNLMAMRDLLIGRIAPNRVQNL
ncbi:MAG: hypothetical protein RLZ98_1283 [Pseudomonadota bacterium]|jgi:GT2 family glycosyltransferase